MITIVEPVFVPPPMDWMVMQDDQHRRPVALAAGLEGEQPKQEWLSSLSIAIRQEVQFLYLRPDSVVVLLLAAVTWIRRYASVYREKIENLSGCIFKALFIRVFSAVWMAL